ncbi:MAG: hypothetical protein FWG14_03575 [Peptococcaceae bacterium]|nr:hypothetical protein [Peptococcaceae bacterium]
MLSLSDLIGQYMNLLFMAVLPCVLHVYFCFRRNNWMGLILPVLFFGAVVTLSINNLFLGGDPLWVLGSFCLFNLPTIGGLIVYVLCRRRVMRKQGDKSL